MIPFGHADGQCWSDRPQRRTALAGRELGRYKRAALSETRLAEVGVIKEVGAGYTFFWSGQKREMHESGVGFAIITGLGGKLTELPKG